MAKRASLDDREKRPIDILFESSEEKTKEELKSNDRSLKNNNIEKKEERKYIRQTYYISEELIEALTMYSSFEKTDKSATVRAALEKYIPEKYKNMVNK